MANANNCVSECVSDSLRKRRERLKGEAEEVLVRDDPEVSDYVFLGVRWVIRCNPVAGAGVEPKAAHAEEFEPTFALDREVERGRTCKCGRKAGGCRTVAAIRAHRLGKPSARPPRANGHLELVAFGGGEVSDLVEKSAQDGLARRAALGREPLFGDPLPEVQALARGRRGRGRGGNWTVDHQLDQKADLLSERTVQSLLEPLASHEPKDREIHVARVRVRGRLCTCKCPAGEARDQLAEQFGISELVVAVVRSADEYRHDTHH